jgi:hypothetical protein
MRSTFDTCVTERNVSEHGSIYEISAVCPSIQITLPGTYNINGWVGNGHTTFQLAALTSLGNYNKYDWRNLSTKQLTANCSACDTPQLEDALRLLCPAAHKANNLYVNR